MIIVYHARVITRWYYYLPVPFQIHSFLVYSDCQHKAVLILHLLLFLEVARSILHLAVNFLFSLLQWQSHEQFRHLLTIPGFQQVWLAIHVNIIDFSLQQELHGNCSSPGLCCDRSPSCLVANVVLSWSESYNVIISHTLLEMSRVLRKSVYWLCLNRLQ